MCCYVAVDDGGIVVTQKTGKVTGRTLQNVLRCEHVGKDHRDELVSMQRGDKNEYKKEVR